jgi:galactokinase
MSVELSRVDAMKLEENRTLRAPRAVGGPMAEAGSDFSSWVVRNLPGEEDRFVGTAPGRLDVLGGLAEYSGGLVLGFPLSNHACAGVQRRSDGMVRIVHHRSVGGNGAAPFEAPVSQYCGSGGKCAEAAAARSPLATQDMIVVCCLGTVIESLRAGLTGDVSSGLSIAVATDLDALRGAGLFAAVSAALLAALSALSPGREHGDGISASVVQSVENDWVGVPAGPADALCSLSCAADSLTLLRCDNKSLGGSFRIPSGLRLVAIDSGLSQEGHSEKYAQVRTATFMGRLLIDRIVRHEGLLGEQWDGHLSRISVNDFVEQIRDRLPTKMTGKDFLDRFGETTDPLTRIDPQRVYKIRSRTEHHIYEHARSRQFVEAFSRGMRKSDRLIFEEAGAAMNASHWSYGQRCGLGSVAANSLVGSLRKAESGLGVFGARIAGRGCGGLVAVLTDDSPAAARTIEDSLEAYRQDYNVPARILSGSLPGAMVSGAVRV